MGRMAVNIDISTGVVFKSAPLTVLCLQFLGERNVNNTQRLQNLPPYERENLNRFVRGLKIYTNGKEEGSRSTIKSISDKPASAYTFKLEDKTSTTVAVCPSLFGLLTRYLWLDSRRNISSQKEPRFDSRVCHVRRRL